MTLPDKQEIYYLCVREHGSIEVGAKLGASVFQGNLFQTPCYIQFLTSSPHTHTINHWSGLQSTEHLLLSHLCPWAIHFLANIYFGMKSGHRVISRRSINATSIFSSTCANQVLQFIVGTALHLKLDGVALGKPPNTSSNTLMPFNDTRIFQYSVIELLDPIWLLSGPGFFSS